MSQNGANRADRVRWSQTLRSRAADVTALAEDLRALEMAADLAGVTTVHERTRTVLDLLSIVRRELNETAYGLERVVRANDADARAHS